jgi:hypothetical protein
MDVHAERDIVAIVDSRFAMESAYRTLAFEFIEAFPNGYFRDAELRGEVGDPIASRFEYCIPHGIDDFKIAVFAAGAGFVLSLGSTHMSPCNDT